MGNRVLIVGKVLFVSRPDLLVDVLQLHEKQRNAVDKSHDIGPPSIELPLYRQFSYDEKVVLLRPVEFEHPEPPFDNFATLIAIFNRDTVLEKIVFFAVDLQGGLGEGVVSDAGDGGTVGRVGKSGIELDEGLSQVAGQDDLFIR